MVNLARRDAAPVEWQVVVVAQGGARNRSGPQPREGSARSEARGFSLTALPAEGYRGRVPKFPLPGVTPRERVVWREAWRSPQACAWALPEQAWRVRTVALWVRTAVRCEDPDVSPTVLAQLHRFADQVGMTTAGLAEMGWKVAPDELAERRPSARPDADAAPPVRRMRSVDGA